MAPPGCLARATAPPVAAAGEVGALTAPLPSAGGCLAISRISGSGSGSRPESGVQLANCWRSSKVNRLGVKDDIDDFTESLDSLVIMLLQFTSVQFIYIHFSSGSVSLIQFSSVQFSSAQFCPAVQFSSGAGAGAGQGPGQAAIVPPGWSGLPGCRLAPDAALSLPAILKSG